MLGGQAMRSLAQLMDLSGRTALITGGGGNIGATAADGLAELGADVVVADLDPRCEEVARGLQEKWGRRAHGVRMDVADEGACRRLVHETVERMGGLDILIHSAGFVGTNRMPGWVAPFEEQTVAAFDAAMRVNLTAAWILAQEAAPTLARGGRGSVILISSIYGSCGPDMRLYEGEAMHNPAAYGASKAGLEQLARYLATVLAPAVRANCVSPGGVERGQPPRFIERYVARTPLGRMATVEDMKGAIAFLASDLSAYVTGQNLLVDGGWTAW
jgi:NAD(P)-dependent dehydrogenase (short-subunit alcohol dehydrogenase family)